MSKECSKNEKKTERKRKKERKKEKKEILKKSEKVYKKFERLRCLRFTIFARDRTQNGSHLGALISTTVYIFLTTRINDTYHLHWPDF